MQCFNAYETERDAIISATATALLKEGGEGEILMVNSAGIYLRAEGGVFLLCDISWGLVPIGIAMEGFVGVADLLGIRAGDRFTSSENAIYFSGGALRFSPVVRESEAVTALTPQLSRIREAALDLVALQKTRGVSMLALPLVLGGEAHGVRALNPYCERAYPLLLSLVNALAECSCDRVRNSVSSLVGLGSGLTPSLDDVLLGMIYAFRLLSDEAPPSCDVLRHIVLSLCDTHTGEVSAAYLVAVISGAKFERIENVWRGLCGAQALDITPLCDVGGSSGSEMLLGILLALRVCGYDATK